MPRAALRHRSGERARRRMRSQITRKKTNAPWRRPRHGQLQRTKNGRRLKLSKWRRQPKRGRKRASSWRRSAWKRPGRRRRSNGKNRNDVPRRTKKSASMNSTWQRQKQQAQSSHPFLLVRARACCRGAIAQGLWSPAPDGNTNSAVSRTRSKRRDAGTGGVQGPRRTQDAGDGPRHEQACNGRRNRARRSPASAENPSGRHGSKSRRGKTGHASSGSDPEAGQLHHRAVRSTRDQRGEAPVEARGAKFSHHCRSSKHAPSISRLEGRPQATAAACRSCNC